MMAIDLGKRQELVPDPKAIEQISFSGNLYQPENITMFFIIEESCASIVNMFWFNITPRKSH